jgi:hypothetical protein
VVCTGRRLSARVISAPARSQARHRRRLLPGRARSAVLLPASVAFGDMTPVGRLGRGADRTSEMRPDQVGPEQIANAAPLIAHLSNPVIKDRLNRVWEALPAKQRATATAMPTARGGGALRPTRRVPAR